MNEPGAVIVPDVMIGVVHADTDARGAEAGNLFHDFLVFARAWVIF